MNVTIANVSAGAVADADFTAAVAAIGLQVSRDFQPVWSIQGTLTGTRLDLGGGQAGINAATDAVIYLGNSSQDPTTGVSNAFGYHFDNYSHIPYGFVYLDVCQQYNEAWTCTLSHEVLELLADPTAVLTVTAPPPNAGPNDNPVYYDLEVCDPTQGDTYTINDVVVSNFVSKYYFGMVGGGSGQSTNFLNLALAPLGVRPGGYLQYEDSQQGTHEVDGSKVTQKRKDARKLLEGYRRNSRRARRFKGHKF